jgi:uncharacterized membrane protein YhaH (DUF805 family)
MSGGLEYMRISRFGRLRFAKWLLLSAPFGAVAGYFAWTLTVIDSRFQPSDIITTPLPVYVAAATVAVALGLPYLSVVAFALAGRLFDLRRSRWFALLAIVPIIGQLLIALLLFAPGSGPRPEAEELGL